MRLNQALIWIILPILVTSCGPSPLPEESIKAYIAAKFEYEKGDFSQAKTALETILKGRSDFFQARFLKAKSEFLTNDFKSSEEDLKLIIQDHPDHLQARFWLVLVEEQTNRLDAAVSQLDGLLALDPQDYRLLYERGLLYLKKGDMKNALDFFRQSSLDESDLAKPRLEAGRIFFGIGDSKASLDQLQRAKVLLGDQSPLDPTIDKLIATVQGNLANTVVQATPLAKPVESKKKAKIP